MFMLRIDTLYTRQQKLQNSFILYCRSDKAVEAASVVQPTESANSEVAKSKSQLKQPIESSSRDAEIICSSVRNRMKNILSLVVETVHEPMPNLGVGELRKPIDCIQQSLNKIQGLFYPDLDLLFLLSCFHIFTFCLAFFCPQFLIQSSQLRKVMFS